MLMWMLSLPRFGFGKNIGFDQTFGFVANLSAGRGEDLDTIILVGIVRCADYYSSIGRKISRKKSNSGRCNYSRRFALRTCSRRSLDQCLLEPTTRLTRVTPANDYWLASYAFSQVNGER